MHQSGDLWCSGKSRSGSPLCDYCSYRRKETDLEALDTLMRLWFVSWHWLCLMIQRASLVFCTTAVKKKTFRLLRSLYPSSNVWDALLEQTEYLGGKPEMDVKKKGNAVVFLHWPSIQLFPVLAVSTWLQTSRSMSVPASYSELLLLWVINFKDKLYFELTEIWEVSCNSLT